VRVGTRLVRTLKAFGLLVLIALATLLVAGNLSGGARTAAILAGVAAALVAVVLSWRISLTFDDDEIVIRNLLRTRRLRWDELDAVSARTVLAPVGNQRVPRVVRFVPRGGPSWGIAAQATRTMGSRAADVFDALREQAEQHGVRYEITPQQEQSMS
jgi:hypothetical protein